jgi:diguanylate cyclase (GGDEF)-like protein
MGVPSEPGPQGPGAPGGPLHPAAVPGTLAGFDVMGVLGRGNQAVAYRVRRDGAEYAMKVLQPQASVQLAPDPESSHRAFRREAALLACTTHPGLAQVHEVGTADGQPYLVMDLVEGRRLTDVLATGPLAPDRLISLAIDVASALAAAHRTGMVHRDIKPDNIVVSPAGRGRLIDFGLAARQGASHDDAVAGTMLYSAPEQVGVLHRPVDGRSDLYALGVVLYQCATGVPPFVSTEVGELLRMHATVQAPDPRQLRPELPPALAGVIGKLLAKDPDDRYQSAAGLVADLERLAADPAARFPPGATDEPVGTRVDHPLVGRSAELSSLLARWRQARLGTGGAAIIEGAPGVGKSRLAREVTAAAARDGALVLFGKSDPDESVPLAPLRAAVDQHLRAVQRLPAAERSAAVERVRAAAGPAASLLRSLSPALAAVLGARQLAEDDHHEQFAAAVADFLAALARAAGGAVLHLDDVQWLDDATRRVVARLADELPDAPLLVLATARDDADGRRAVAAVRSGLAGAVDLTVRLEPLTPAGVADLVAAVTGGKHIDPRAAESLAARSDGNPFTLVEYLAALIDAGLVRPAWGTLLIDGDGLENLDLPLDAVELVLERLDRLDPRSRRLLGMAAAVGGRFAPDLVAEVCEIEPERMAEIVSLAAWRHLVEADDGGYYRFLHDRMREALLAQFDPAALHEVHERISDVLERRGGGDPQAVYDLARHCRLGEPNRNPARVFRSCTAAGRLALAEQAPAEALAFLESAAGAAERAGIEAGSAFLEAFGVAQHRTGRFSAAVRSLELARSRAGDPTDRARILGLIARVHDNTWSTADQAATVDEALRELGRPLPRNRLVLVLSTLGLFLAGCLVGLTRIGRGGVRGRKRELFRLLCSLYDTGALAYARELRPTVSVIYTLRQVYLANRLGPGPESARMQIAAAHLALAVGLKRVARRCTSRALATAERVGDPRLTAYVVWLQALDRLFFGADQGESVRRALAEQGRWLDVGHRIDLIHVLAMDVVLSGDLDGAEDVFRRRRALVRDSDRTSRMALHITEAGLLALQGRAAEAAAYLDGMRAQGGELMWERIDILYAAVQAAVEQRDVGTRFELAAAEFDATGVRPMFMVPAQFGYFVYLAYGRLEQCRGATPEELPQRCQSARAAARQLRGVAVRPLLKAHHRVIKAALLEVSGKPEAALRELDRGRPVLWTVDAPLVSFEAARVRAHALRAMGVVREAEREAHSALSIALEYGWPHRARQVSAEFDLRTLPDTVSRSLGALKDSVAAGLYRQRLEAIEQVSLAASRVLDPKELAVVALDETIRILGAERAFLFLVEGPDGHLTPFGGRDSGGNDLRDLTGYSASLVERIRAGEEAVVVTGTDEAAALGAESVVTHNLRSIMVAPLRLDGRLIGVVYLDSRVATGLFTANDIGVLIAITNHVAVALETARAAQLEVAVAAANRQRDVAETLREALAAVSGTLEPDEVLNRLLQTVCRMVGDRGWLVQGQPDAPTVRLVGACSRGLVEPTFAAPDDRLRELLAATGPVVGDTAGRPAVLAGSDLPVGSWLAVPLRGRDEPVGLLLLSSERVAGYDQGEAEIAAALADQGMIAYDNARLFARVQVLASIDELTGLANRRQFFQLADREFWLARRHGRQLTAMMIDIDHFKTINDRYGHPIGDEVIRTTAARVARSGRGSELVGRYGGEEFAMVLDPGEERAELVAERLRRSIADTPVDTAAGQLNVTVSVGVTYLQSADADVNALLNRADLCLYQAKRAGRNRVHLG